VPVPSWFDKDRERVNRNVRKQERERAREIGGRPQAGSGCSWRAPGDVKEAEYLEELKLTSKESYRLTLAEWKDIRNKASTQGREPRYLIEFADGTRLIVTEA
jgi:hypothetical protein